MFKRTNFTNLFICLLIAVIGGGVGILSWALDVYILDEFMALDPKLETVFLREGIDGVVMTLSMLGRIAGGLMVIAGLAGLCLKRRPILALMRLACFSYYVTLAFYLYTVQRGLSLIFAEEIELFGVVPDQYQSFLHAWDLTWPAWAGLAFVMIAHLNLHRRMIANLYSRAEDESPAGGDAALENLRTHGSDPQYRKSIFGSLGIHLAILVLIPWLAGLLGCVEPYRVPKGRGNPVVALVRMVKPKKKKKKKRLILNPQSAIIFKQPDIDDSKILKQVDSDTQLTYNFTKARGGRMGAGGKGKGGWPDGMDDAVVRFIRIKYSGRHWDDGMHASQAADENFLQFFHKITNFKVRDHSEAHAASLLDNYPKGMAPPFVYMTGDRSINMSERGIRALRAYCLDGGMLFADCGGVQWDQSFRQFIRRVFPEKQLVVIPDDDPIFRMPYEFAEGAPPLWHHGGRRALGMKHKGRWCVFYHPGDINDAWKTGNSGLRRHEAQQAFEMGVNIIYYSFTKYLEATRKYRKR